MTSRCAGRKIRLALLSFILAGAVLIAGARSQILLAAQPVLTTAPDQPEIILVQFPADLAPQERTQRIAQMNGELLAWLPALNIAQIRLNPQRHAFTTAMHLNQLQTDETILFAEPDGLVQAAMTPNDPDSTDQRKVYAPEQINLPAGWEYTTGDKDIVIAILDSGIMAEHPEFTDRLLPGYDFVQQDNDPNDENGHGTHVAGIVGARINNGLGIAGVCARCALLPVRVLNAQNIGSWMSVAQGVTYAVDHGARVIVMSLGSTIYSHTMKNAVDYARAHGVLLVAAAGNANTGEPFYPAAFPEVIGVGAMTRQNERWPFSNYGSNVTVMAPGDGIYSTYPDFYRKSASYQSLTGTSMAAPFVAGLAGLLFSQSPTRTITEVTQLITTSAVDLGEPGVDDRYGAGRIDVAAALAAGAATPIPSGGLQGIAWQDHDLNGRFDPTREQAMAGLVIQVENERKRRIGLAVTNSMGAWRMSGLPTGAYTLHVTSTLAADLSPTPELRVVLTEPVMLANLNFAFTGPPTANAITDFILVRTHQQITLTWAVLHPLVSAIQVQRATAEDGVYTTILTRDITAQEVADRQPITITDTLPEELSQGNVYYRLVLDPNGVSVGPKAAWSVQATSGRTLFAPLIISYPEISTSE